MERDRVGVTGETEKEVIERGDRVVVTGEIDREETIETMISKEDSREGIMETKKGEGLMAKETLEMEETTRMHKMKRVTK